MIKIPQKQEEQIPIFKLFLIILISSYANEFETIT